MSVADETFEREKRNVGDGWQSIIAELHEDLKGILGDEYTVVQIKEKFGGLRYYIFTPDNSTMDARMHANRMIDVSEAVSLRTCEWCGSVDNVTTDAHGGWFKTFCATHHEERRAK